MWRFVRFSLCLSLVLVSGASSGWGRVDCVPASVVLTTVSGKQMEIVANASYVEWPSRVGCNSRSLWSNPLPQCPVRIGLQCKARYGAGYWFGSDGYTVRGSGKWVKVWDSSAMSRTPGQTYIVDAQRPTARGEIRI